MSEHYDAGGGWMSESSALTKWCPWARVPHRVSGSAINRSYDTGNPAQGTLCIGKRCMTWEVASFNRPEHGRCGMGRGE